MTGFRVGKAKWPEPIRCNDERMQRDAIAMAAGELRSVDGIVTVPPAFAVLAGFRLNGLTDRSPPSFREIGLGLPVLIGATSATHSIVYPPSVDPCWPWGTVTG